MRFMLLPALVLLAAAPSFAEEAHFGGGPRLELTQDDVAPSQRQAMRQNIAAYAAAHPLDRSPRIAGVKPYPFFPQAGNLWDDLFVNNFVDLDSTSPGTQDFECNNPAWTYDGHQGHDSGVRSFAYSDIGVPVFAALDGTVVDTHDGEWDRQTSQTNDAQANYVVLSHGSGQNSIYYHFRRGSVAVKVGDAVKAGQQLGLTGSSGYSTGPHLHFESQLNGTPYEPSAGACRPGTSNWVNQTPVRHDLYLDECVITDAFLDDIYNPVYGWPRTSVFLTENHRVTTWAQIHNLPANSTWYIKYLFPSGAVDFTTSTYNFGNTTSYRWADYWFYFYVNPNVTGTWRTQLYINGQLAGDAPFNVVSSLSQVVNHPPAAITAVLDPAAPQASDTVFCRVNSALLFTDPDYDIVRYHYVWTVNGTVVRDVTTAGRADAVPHDTAPAGSVLKCVVTPSDGQANGPGATVQAAIGAGTANDVDGNGTFNIADVVLATRINGGLAAGDAGQVSRGHGGPGSLDTKDAERLLRTLFGL